MRIKPILYGAFLFLAMEAWATILNITEAARPDLFSLFLQAKPWLIIGVTLLLGMLAAIVPPEWWEEKLLR